MSREVVRRAGVWSLAAGAALWGAALVWAPSARGADGGGGRRAAASLVFEAGARICHQRADRSFAVGGRPMPVCGRCAGLYLAVPLGLAAAALRSGRVQASPRRWLLAATVPTVTTLVVEWTAIVPVDTWARALASLPLGLAVGWIAGAALTGDLA